MSKTEKARRGTGILWRLQKRLKNPHVLILYNQFLKKKASRVALQPADPANNCHGARPEEGASHRTDPLRRLDVRQSGYADDECGAGRLPPTSSHVLVQSIPYLRPKAVLQEHTGACVPSQAVPIPPPPRQSNRHTARTAVPVMTNTRGFHALWRLSGSKACSRRGAAPRQAPAEPT